MKLDLSEMELNETLRMVLAIGKDCLLMYSFLMTSAMVLHKSVELVPNSFVIRILLHQSASSPDGPAPPLALTAGLFTKSVSMASNYFG